MKKKNPISYGITGSSGTGAVSPDGLHHDGLVTVSGAPPLTITKAKAAVPESITIFGNTVDGNSVGDKTNNLFYPTVFDFAASGGLKYELQADGGIHIYGTKTKDGTWLAIKSLFELSALSYTPRLSVVPDAANESMEITKNKWGVLYTTDTKTDTYVSPYYSTIKLSESEALKSVKFYYTDPIATGTYVDITLYLMLNSGSAAIDYEPYGYKLPLINNDTNYYTVFMPFQLNSADLLIIAPKAFKISVTKDSIEQDISDIQLVRTIPALCKGANCISAGTAVPPSVISISA
ncbi:MAG: hypothetical protein ACI4DP_08455 [Candidatus Ornithomonoglobus sp.]